MASVTMRPRPSTTLVNFSKVRRLARLHDPVLRLLLLFRGGQHAGDVIDRQMGVPGSEIAQFCKSAHRLAIRGDRRERRRPARRGSELVARAATTKLAARRLTSHSNGPGSVSSKSLISNARARSGDPYVPKLARWASPQSCTVRPVVGMVARSMAMMAAPPRWKANGEAM